MAISVTTTPGSVPYRATATGGADSGHSVTVPDNVEWKVESVFASFTGSAATGDRQPALEVLDRDSNVVYRMLTGTTYAAGATINVQFGPAMPDMTSVRGGTFLSSPIDHLFIPSGYSVRVRDASAATATGDALTVSLMAVEFGTRT